MIDLPPVCLVSTRHRHNWFIGVTRDETGQWVYASTDSRDEVWTVEEITTTYGPVTWFALTEDEHLDPDTAL